MSEYQSITRMDIERKFTSNNLKISRVLSLSMVFGTFLFFLTDLYLYLISGTPDDLLISESSITIHIYTLLVLGVIVYSLFIFAPKLFLNKKYLINKLTNKMYDENRREITDPVLKMITVERIYMIIRLALLEGISLFALVVLFLAVSNLEVHANPLLWLLVVPLIIQAGFTFKNYFSKDSYLDRIENEILAPLNEI